MGGLLSDSDLRLCIRGLLGIVRPGGEFFRHEAIAALDEGKAGTGGAAGILGVFGHGCKVVAEREE